MTDDEKIVLDFHPHWTTLLKSILLTLLVAAVAGVGIALVPHSLGVRNQVRLGIAGAALLVIVIFCIAPFLRWFTTRYILTTHRLTLREGVLARSGRDIPIARVNDVSFRHSLIQRMLGSGTLTVESAGERGQVVLQNIPHVERVQRELYKLMEDWADGHYDGPGGPGGPYGQGPGGPYGQGPGGPYGQGPYGQGPGGGGPRRGR